MKEHYKHTISKPTEDETARWKEIKFYIYMRMILETYELPQHAILFAHLFCIEDKYDKKLDALAQQIIGMAPNVIPSKKEIIVLAYKHNVPVMKIRSIVHTTQQYIYNIIDNWDNDEWYHPIHDAETDRLIDIFNNNVEHFGAMIKLGGIV